MLKLTHSKLKNIYLDKNVALTIGGFNLKECSNIELEKIQVTNCKAHG